MQRARAFVVKRDAEIVAMALDDFFGDPKVLGHDKRISASIDCLRLGDDYRGLPGPEP